MLPNTTALNAKPTLVSSVCKGIDASATIYSSPPGLKGMMLKRIRPAEQSVALRCARGAVQQFVTFRFLFQHQYVYIPGPALLVIASR